MKRAKIAKTVQNCTKNPRDTKASKGEPHYSEWQKYTNALQIVSFCAI